VTRPAQTRPSETPGCRDQNRSCININRKFHGDIDLACLASGATCFKEVSDTCQAMSDGCGNCGISLCGGGEWKFDSEVPLTVTLVAAADLSNPRVLAASTLKGNQAVLNVPADIRLKDKEQLYLQFASTAKPKGNVKVQVRRGK
jgi:hypothetical protein